MERNIKPTYDELESYVENLQKQLADAQATIAALQARLDERLEFIKDCDIALDRIQAPHTSEGQEELVSTWRRIELVGSLLSQYRSTLEQMSTQLTQRTAELEAAKAIQAIDLKNNNAYREQVATLQAELERVSLLHSHNERRLEVVDKRYKELHRLLAALPKVEGEIRVIEVATDEWHVYDTIFATKAGADNYAALLQHRQGMEG